MLYHWAVEESWWARPLSQVHDNFSFLWIHKKPHYQSFNVFDDRSSKEWYSYFLKWLFNICQPVSSILTRSSKWLINSFSFSWVIDTSSPSIEWQNCRASSQVFLSEKLFRSLEPNLNQPSWKTKSENKIKISNFSIDASSALWSQRFSCHVICQQA